MDLLGIPAPALAAIGAAGAGLITFGAVAGIRKLIGIGQFAYHNSRLSTIGNPYVTREEVLPLLELGSPEALSKTVTSDLLPGNANFDSFREVDSALVKNYHVVLGSLLNSAPSSVLPFMRSYMALPEGEELKRLIRLLGTRKEPLFPVGRITEDLERQILSSKDLSSSMEVLEGLRISSRISEISRSSNRVDMVSIDETIDRFSLDELKGTEGSFAVKRGTRAFFDILCDRYNIHLILRAKGSGKDRDSVISSLHVGGIIGRTTLEQMIDSAGPKEAVSVLSGSYLEPFLKDVDAEDHTSLETTMSRVILEGVKGLSHSYGSSIGPTIRYVVSKEMELRNLRVLYQSAFSNWDPERTRKLLLLEEGS